MAKDGVIRHAAIAKFRELLPLRATVGDMAFRKAVRVSLIEALHITGNSASTHYNYAKIEVTKTNPELVVGLGRAEDKKGGRKKKQAPVAAPLLLLTYTPAAPAVQEQVLFTVKKKSDGSIVADGLSFEAATAICYKAKAAKKAALYWV